MPAQQQAAGLLAWKHASASAFCIWGVRRAARGFLVLPYAGLWHAACDM